MRRRRGATFTVIVLLASALLLAIGGAFVDSSRKLVELAGIRERQAQAKEALAGATVWARAAVAAGDPPAKTTLKLSAASVDVVLKQAGGGGAWFVDATARSGEISARASASIAQRGSHWAISRFEIVEGAEPPRVAVPKEPPRKKFH